MEWCVNETVSAYFIKWLVSIMKVQDVKIRSTHLQHPYGAIPFGGANTFWYNSVQCSASSELQRLIENKILKILTYRVIINSCRKFENVWKFVLNKSLRLFNNLFILVSCLYWKHTFRFKNEVPQKCTECKYSFV